MDVHDDNERMNEDAAHKLTAFVIHDRLSSEDVLVITLSRARARHKYSYAPPTPEKIGLGSADFLHSGSGYIEIAVFVPCRFQLQFQSRFSAWWNASFYRQHCAQRKSAGI